MKKINCTYARFAAWDGERPLYECNNRKSGKYMHAADDKTCTVCRARVQLSPYLPPIIDQKPEDRQITIDEYLSHAAS